MLDLAREEVKIRGLKAIYSDFTRSQQECPGIA